MLRVTLPILAGAPSGPSTVYLVAHSPATGAQGRASNRLEAINLASVALTTERGEAESFSARVVDVKSAFMQPVIVKNTSVQQVSESYVLRAMVIDGSAVTVTFHTAVGGRCVAGEEGPPLSQMDALRMNDSRLICARVSPLGDTSLAVIDFSARSTATGAVSTLRGTLDGSSTVVGLSSSHNGTVRPGGTQIYAHTLVNLGNVTIAAGTLALQGTNDKAEAGWTTQIYPDLNGTGKIEGLTPLEPNAKVAVALEAGDQLPLLVVVGAPVGAANGERNITTVTVSSDGLSVSTTDATTVSSGDINMTKLQAVRDCGDAVVPPPTAFAAKPLAARPGQCIWYRIVIKNDGADAASMVKLRDSVPAFTEIQIEPSADNGVAVPVANGLIEAALGDLSSGQSVVVHYQVRINH